MRVVVGGRVRRGRAVDLAGAGVDADELVRAVRGEASGVTVDCSDPGPAHAHVGLVRTGTSFDRRAALAAAARSLGMTPSNGGGIDDLRARLASLSLPKVAVRAARRRAAEAGDAETELRERVAALRGKIEALEETGGDADAVREELRSTVGRLSEAETERIAAEQRLDRAERAARDARDVRERRLRLEDELANRRREARAELAARVDGRFEAALGAIPGDDAATAALAVVRIAEMDAPVVLAGLDRFADAGAAEAALDSPVVRL